MKYIITLILTLMLTCSTGTKVKQTYRCVLTKKTGCIVCVSKKRELHVKYGYATNNRCSKKEIDKVVEGK